MPKISKPPRVRSKTFLRAWRKAKKLSQEAAAAKIDLDRTSLSRIERGEQPYSQDVIEQLAEIYDCKPGDLLGADPADPGAGDMLIRYRAAPASVRRIVDMILRDAASSREVREDKDRFQPDLDYDQPTEPTYGALFNERREQKPIKSAPGTAPAPIAAPLVKSPARPKKRKPG